MKRLNPDTGKPFKHGHIRADGFVFWGYNNQTNKAGFFYEMWVTPEKFEAKNKHLRKWQKATGYPKQYRKANADRCRKLTRDWYKDNPAKRAAKRNKHRAAKLNRTPRWLSKEQLRDIADFYIIAQMFRMYTGEQYHVDHIVPLQGKKVSGLHVPWNLQVLPAIENIAKNNKHSIC